MKSAARFRAACAVLLATVGACGGSRRPAPQQVLDPPRFDLKQYGKLALVTFTVENARGDLHTVATSKFAEWVIAAQPGVEILEVGVKPDSARVAQAPVAFRGHLKVSEVKPSASLAGLTSGRVEAKVTIELSVQLVSTSSGGTLWRASSIRTETLGRVGLTGGLPYFSAEDQDKAYSAMITELVRQVTWDFRPTWRTL
jgi:hypothetical protein